MKFVPYVPSMIPLSRLDPMNTHASIRHTSSPVPIKKSKMKWNGVPVRPPAWHPHFFSFESRTAEYIAEKNSGTRPMPGFTWSRPILAMVRMGKAGIKDAKDMARRAWGVDFWKMVGFIMVAIV